MSRFLIQFKSFNLGLSVLITGLTTLLLWYAFRPGRPDPGSTKLLEELSNLDKSLEEEDILNHTESDTGAPDDDDATEVTRKSGNKNPMTKIVSDSEQAHTQSNYSNATTPLTSNVRPSSTDKNAEDKDVATKKSEFTSSAATRLASIHAQIEEIDKKGKVLFKNKQFFEAAEAFTEAMNLIEAKKSNEGDKDSVTSSSLQRQLVTLLNNRSAMYEKAELPDLALIDCDTILDMDPSHSKARTRKLRILESMERFADALVEVCALQLKFMQDNREKLRLGIPVSPPVPQTKVEDLVGMILPTEIEREMKKIKGRYGHDRAKSRPLPSNHTIHQLLKSFSGHNAWMAAAARDGTIDVLSTQLDACSVEDDATRIDLLYKRGRRYAYQRKFDLCVQDFDTAYDILERGGERLSRLLSVDVHARVLEWVGMSKHLRYDLEGANKCYEACSNIDPTNSEILIKRAGVQMDAGKADEALSLFDIALGLDPTASDALVHRANLYMLQQKMKEAKNDLERCLELRPDSILARLRLATVLMTSEDLTGATKCLDMAEKIDPDSSEVHSYKGELLFTQGDFDGAKIEFNRAIKLDAGNPSPYVNAALVVLNTPGVNGGPPLISDAIKLLEKAIEVDPQFQQAYLHLGQLKLSMATTLSAAREVVILYDKALEYCRAAEELKDIVSMRILTVAQIEAARLLKMETLSIQ